VRALLFTIAWIAEKIISCARSPVIPKITRASECEVYISVVRPIGVNANASADPPSTVLKGKRLRSPLDPDVNSQKADAVSIEM